MNIIYWLNLFFFLFCIIQHVRGKVKYLPLLYLFTFVLICVRGNVVLDSVSDLTYFEQMFLLIKDEGLKSIPLTLEPGFAILLKVTSLFTSDFHTFLLLYNTFLMTSLFVFANRLSVSPYLTLALVVLIAFNQSIYVIRQWLAISIVLYSYPYIIKKEFWKFLIVSLLAFSCHYTSFVWIPVYFIVNYTNKKNYFFILTLYCISLFIAFSFINQIGAGISDKYAELYLSDNNSAPFTNFFIQLSFFLTACLFMHGDILRNPKNKVIVFISFMSVATTLFGISLYLVQRLALYYSITNVILVPNTMNYIKNRALRIAYVVIVLLFLFIIYQMSFERGLSKFVLK